MLIIGGGVTKKESNEGKERERERGVERASGRFACLHAHLTIISKAFWDTRGRLVEKRRQMLRPKTAAGGVPSRPAGVSKGGEAACGDL